MLKKITDFTYEETKDLLRRNAKLREIAKAQTYQFMNGFVNDYLAYVKGSCIYTRGETSISDFKVLEYRSFIYDIISCDEEHSIKTMHGKAMRRPSPTDVQLIWHGFPRKIGIS